MADEQKRAASPAGEQVILSLFKLLQVVKVHQPNNRLFIESIADFRRAVMNIGRDRDNPCLRIVRDRLYLDADRLVMGPGLMKTGDKLIAYLQARHIYGLRFYAGDGPPASEDVVNFIRLLNAAEKENDPFTWLQLRLDKANCAWVDLLADQDLKSSGSGAGRESVVQTDGSGSEDRRQSVTTLARKTYSHALTSIINLTRKLGTHQRVGIQKSKRVVQSLIDILMEDESVLLGMSTIRNYDDYTYTHSVNVAILAMCLGKKLGLNRSGIEQVGLCALFHDLGKVEVPINLIQKEGGLTEDEYEQVKTHPLHSVSQIIRLNADHDLKRKLLLAPFEHHLGNDLTGYPRSDRKTPVSLFGRILTVVDIYDAMTSGRSYRPEPISPDQALRLMADDAGTKLDPIILKAFIDMMGIYPVGTLLFLDTREVGLTMETPERGEPGRPLVRLLFQVGEDQVIMGDSVDLAERDQATGSFLRNIVRCAHPSEYGLQPADFLI